VPAREGTGVGPSHETVPVRHRWRIDSSLTCCRLRRDGPGGWYRPCERRGASGPAGIPPAQVPAVNIGPRPVRRPHSVPLVPTTVMNPPREPGPSSKVEVVIPSDPAEARRVQDEIEQHLRAHQASEKEIFGIRLALEEALVNAIKHGNQMDRSKKVSVVS